MADNGVYERIYEAVSRIPAGKVTSYGHIALMVERPGAARLVGWAMRTLPEGLPWYRVVRADGTPNFPEQRALLEAEGVTFRDDGRVDMSRHDW